MNTTRVAVGERRRDLPGGDRDREVPRRDDADDADRLARDLDVDVRPDAGELLARNPQRFAGEEVEDLPGAGRLADRLGQRLALFAREQPAELLAAGEDFGRDAQQDVVALLRRRARPGRERRHAPPRSRRSVCAASACAYSPTRSSVFDGLMSRVTRRAVDPFSGDIVLVRRPWLPVPDVVATELSCAAAASNQAPPGEIAHERAGSERPALALFARAHAIDEPAELLPCRS